MKIVFLDSQTIGEDISLSSLSQMGELVQYNNATPENLIERARGADVLITNKVKINKQNLDSLPGLKLICIAATGMDHIDLVAAKEKGILVKNVKGYSTASVAQHTFTLLFYLLGESSYYHNYTSKGEWKNSDIFTHIDKPYWELAGKQWGIIGLGEIGKQVATIASAFGCNIKYYSTSGKNNSSDYDSVSLEKLLSESDIISIHAPLNGDTKNLIKLSELELMKPNSILLNLGRGGIICEQDLAQILNKRTDIKVGLDVIEAEPMGFTSALNPVLENENLFITPHIAWASREARQRLISGIVNNIKESNL